MPQSTPKIFLAQGLPGVEPAAPFEEGKPRVTVIKRFNGAELFGGGAGSVVGSENGHRNNTNAGMTPGPALFHPLPSRASVNALAEQQHHLGTGNGNGQGEGLYSRLERVGSTGSLRSQGSYGKFDSSKYVDPAFWGAPSLVPGQIHEKSGGFGSPASR